MDVKSATRLSVDSVNITVVGNLAPVSPTETEKTEGDVGVESDSKGVVSSSCNGNENSYQDCRIYVSNIPFSYRSRDLIEMFSPFGTVSDAEVVMNERGSKGFGFVTLDSKQASEAARSALNGTIINGRIIEVKRATAMPSRRSCISTRPQHVSVQGSNVVLPKMGFFGPRQLPLGQPHFVHANPVEQLNALLVRQNQMSLQSIINPTAPSDISYSTLFVPRQFPSRLHQNAVVANGVPLSPLGIPSIPLQFLYTAPSVSAASPASNQPLTATVLPFHTPGFAYTSIPNVNQAGVFIQSPVPPYTLAQDVSSNAKVILDTNLPMSQTSSLTYTGYLDLLGTLGLGNGIVPSPQNVTTSNVAQNTQAHTLRSLDQSCVIDTSLHGEPLKEGQFGPIGSAVPPGNVSQSSSTNEFSVQSSVSLDVHTFGYPSGNESLYTVPVYHHFEPSTDRSGRKRFSTLDGYHLSKKVAKSG